MDPETAALLKEELKRVGLIEAAGVFKSGPNVGQVAWRVNTDLLRKCVAGEVQMNPFLIDLAVHIMRPDNCPELKRPDSEVETFDVPAEPPNGSE